MVKRVPGGMPNPKAQACKLDANIKRTKSGRLCVGERNSRPSPLFSYYVVNGPVA